jgi:hypothetical protein
MRSTVESNTKVFLRLNLGQDVELERRLKVLAHLLVREIK